MPGRNEEWGRGWQSLVEAKSREISAKVTTAAQAAKAAEAAKAKTVEDTSIAIPEEEIEPVDN